MMVQPLQQRLEDFFHVEEIDDEAGKSIHLARESEFDAVGMAMQAPAAMGFRHMRQMVRGLESEGLSDGHGHGAVLKRFQAKRNPVRIKN